MKLILREDVYNLGKGGDLVEVKPGYGRNFLIPGGLAVLANPKNIREVEHQKAVAAAKAAKLKAGSVTAMDVAEALAARGLDIDRRTIDLSEPIKTLGDFEVSVKLHSDVVGKVKVKVEAEP
jgi:large subunit ribosomal protein L9